MTVTVGVEPTAGAPVVVSKTVEGVLTAAVDVKKTVEGVLAAAVVWTTPTAVVGTAAVVGACTVTYCVTVTSFPAALTVIVVVDVVVVKVTDVLVTVIRPVVVKKGVTVTIGVYMGPLSIETSCKIWKVRVNVGLALFCNTFIGLKSRRWTVWVTVYV